MNNKELPLREGHTRTLERLCKKCGKSYTINTVNPKEDLSKYPEICPTCDGRLSTDKIKAIQDQWNKKEKER